MSIATATALMRGLASAGVRDVVVCPGSRSAPLAVAAARNDELRVHSAIDERSAGFFALGIGRASGRPAAVVCTSGTAGAHLYPAVIEAAMSEVPLVAITADRPPELQHCGSPQTIDQQKLFGHFTRAALSCDAGHAPRSLRAAVATAAQAVATSRGPIPGPVHINAPARKPLLDGEAPPEPPAPAIEPPRLRPAAAALDALTARIESARRPLICAGPAPQSASRYREAMFEAARTQSIPLLAEATSQLRLTCIAETTPAIAWFADILLAPIEPALRPDLVIQVGLPASAGLIRLCAEHDIERVVLAAHRYADPEASAAAIVIGDLEDSVRAIASARPTHLESRQRLVNAWRRADASVDRADPETGLGGQAAARAAIAALPAGAALVVGNSLAVRWLDQAVAPGSAELDVFSQRGTSGIDGLIAGAAGVAATGDRPVCLLIGDVSFAHDIGSLALAARLASPLIVVVLDNGGGKIFDELPYAEKLSATERELFTTPPSVDIASAARAFGLSVQTVDSADALEAAVREASDRSGATVIHASCAPRCRPTLSRSR